MSQSPTAPRRLPEGGGLNPVHLSQESEVSSSNVPQFRQCLACILATLTMGMVGIVYGWTRTSLVLLTTGSRDVPLTLKRYEYSWSVSLTVLGSMIGSLLAAEFADRTGRKNCLLVCSTMFTVGWFIIYVATYVPMLYLALVILGIGVGIAHTINPMFVSEVADIKLRGRLGTLIAANVYSGSLITYALAMCLTYKLQLMLLVTISLIFILSIACFPETPYFLVTKGQKEQACKSIAYYKAIEDPRRVMIELRALCAQYELHQQSRSDLHSQSRSDLHSQSRSDLSSQSRSNLPSQSIRETHSDPIREVDTEATSDVHRSFTCEIHGPFTSQIQRPSTSQILPRRRNEREHSRPRRDLRRQSSVDSRASTGIPETYMDGTKYTCLNKLRGILQRSNRKALLIMLGLIMAQQLSGNFITTQYLEVLISRKTSFIDLYEAMILVQLVRILSGYLTTLIVEWYGRRTLLIVSTLGSCYTLLILAGYLLLAEHKYDIISFLPVIDLILYHVVFQIGLGTLPNVLLCELFPTKLKGFVGAIVVIFDGIIGFTASKLYQMIAHNMGSYLIYITFATSCWMAFLMVFIWVPETKGKTYQEIEALLVGENLNSLNEKVKTDEMDIRRI